MIVCITGPYRSNCGPSSGAHGTQGQFAQRPEPLPELTVFGMMLGSGKEIVHFMRATRSVSSAFYVAKRLSKHFAQVMRYGRGMTLTNGNALAGRLVSRVVPDGEPSPVQASQPGPAE